MTMKWNIFIVLILVVVIHTLLNIANASGWQGPPGPPGADGIDGLDGMDGKCDCSGRQLSDDDLDAIFAGAMAADAVNFSFGTRKKQFGIGVATYSGRNAVSVGVGWLVETEEMEYLLSLKAAVTDQKNDVAVGVGATVLIGDSK